MNKPLNKQRGDASAFLIVFLIVGLLGALGFIAWQNFSQKDEPVTTNQTDKQTVEPDNTLALSEWGVEIPLDNTDLDLTATFEDGFYYLTATVEGCDVATGNAGAITRYGNETDKISATDNNPKLQAYDGKTYADLAANSENGQFTTVDEVVYGLDSPQATSCEDSGDAELANYNVVKNSLFPALRKAK